MRARRGFETSSPKAARITPKITDERTAVPAALGISRCFLIPMSRDIITFAPMESPADRLTIRAAISPFVPTAASAPFSPKRPITAVSAELKSCWTTLVRSMGRANIIIFPARGPFNISVPLLFSFSIKLLLDI